jgi:hypothetical protein
MADAQQLHTGIINAHGLCPIGLPLVVIPDNIEIQSRSHLGKQVFWHHKQGFIKTNDIIKGLCGGEIPTGAADLKEQIINEDDPYFIYHRYKADDTFPDQILSNDNIGWESLWHPPNEKNFTDAKVCIYTCPPVSACGVGGDAPPTSNIVEDYSALKGPPDDKKPPQWHLKNVVMPYKWMGGAINIKGNIYDDELEFNKDGTPKVPKWVIDNIEGFKDDFSNWKVYVGQSRLSLVLDKLSKYYKTNYPGETLLLHNFACLGADTPLDRKYILRLYQENKLFSEIDDGLSVDLSALEIDRGSELSETDIPIYTEHLQFLEKTCIIQRWYKQPQEKKMDTIRQAFYDDLLTHETWSKHLTFDLGKVKPTYILNLYKIHDIVYILLDKYKIVMFDENILYKLLVNILIYDNRPRPNKEIITLFKIYDKFLSDFVWEERDKIIELSTKYSKILPKEHQPAVFQQRNCPMSVDETDASQEFKEFKYTQDMELGTSSDEEDMRSHGMRVEYKGEQKKRRKGRKKPKRKKSKRKKPKRKKSKRKTAKLQKSKRKKPKRKKSKRKTAKLKKSKRKKSKLKKI